MNLGNWIDEDKFRRRLDREIEEIDDAVTRVIPHAEDCECEDCYEEIASLNGPRSLFAALLCFIFGLLVLALVWVRLFG